MGIDYTKRPAQPPANTGSGTERPRRLPSA